MPSAGLRSIATYLPAWGDGGTRIVGPDEDAITLAVAAGRSALAAGTEHLAPWGDDVTAVVLVTRDLPQLEGSSTGPLLAGLDLPDTTYVSVILGGAPATVDALLHAAPGTLVIGTDTGARPGAAAALVGERGLHLESLSRVDRSLPTHVRTSGGAVFDYDDARLSRERGLQAGLRRLELNAKPVALAGLRGKDAASVTVGGAPVLSTVGASAPLFALATLAETRTDGPLVAFEEATLVAAEVSSGPVVVVRREAEPKPLPKRRKSADATIAISLPAYERAFDAKLRLEAGRCRTCGTLALPPRFRCLHCGSEAPHDLVPLPRTGEVYTTVTVRVPVPGLETPYSLAIVELGDTGVRILVHVTDTAPGVVEIGDTGSLVLRRVATRAGIPDYGYAFVPTLPDAPPPAERATDVKETVNAGGPA